MKGLKMLRKGADDRNRNLKLEHKCENCGCIRYNKCTCMKKRGA